MRAALGHVERLIEGLIRRYQLLLLRVEQHGQRGASLRAPPGNHPLHQRQGIGVAVLCLVQTSKIIQGCRIVGMIRTANFLSDSQSLLVERLGIGVTAPPLVKVAEPG